MLNKSVINIVGFFGCLTLGLLTTGCGETDPVHVGYSSETYVNLISRQHYTIRYAELHVRFLVPLPNGEQIIDNYNVDYTGNGRNNLILDAYKYHTFASGSGIAPYSEPIEIADGTDYNVNITIGDLSSSHSCVIRRDANLAPGQYFVESPSGLDFLTYGLQQYPYATANFDVTPTNALVASIVGSFRITLEHQEKIKKHKKDK